MSVLSISHLRIRRGDTLILDDVSWQIERGQHWVILGANGSGKTSLLSALTGYLTPTAGSIELFGKQFGRADWRELRKRVGLVSSSIRQLIPNSETALATVVSGKYAMIDLWGKITRADKTRALDLLQQIECKSLANRTWECLSQGERQRVLIGRALMAKPALLILDEPCAGLDPAARETFLKFLQRLGRNQHSPTLVFVTHHVEEIMPVFSHVLILKGGRVFSSAKKKEALNSKALSAAFATPMRLEKKNGRYSLALSRSSRRII